VVIAASTATIGNNATVTLAGSAPDLTITADPRSISTTKALAAKGASGTAFGLGLSIAVSVVDDTTTAAIGDNVTLTGTRALTLSATGGHTSTIQAENGAKTTAAGSDAITPVIAVGISIL